MTHKITELKGKDMLRKLLRLRVVMPLVFALFLTACNPLGITMEQRVEAVKANPSKFSFNHYRYDRDTKMEYFRQLFPVGTSKEFVDAALIEGGNAAASTLSKSHKDSWRYQEPKMFLLPAGPGHNFVFDANKKVKNINFALTDYLYPND